MKQVVVGVFDSDTDAQRAMQLLVAEGTDPDDVRITQAQGQGSAASSAQADTGLMNRVRHFFSDRFRSDAEPEVGHYAEVVRRGGAILRVEVEGDAQLEDVQKAFTTAGALDIDQRIDSWRAQDGGSGGAQVSRAGMDTAADRAEEVIPVVEEELIVGKRRVSTGGLRVYARAVETPVTEAVQLRTEHAEVKRRPVDRPASSADLSNFQDRTIEVRETAEVPVVQKSARVVEELRVSKTVEERTEQIDDTVRSTEVEVERRELEPGTRGPASKR